MPLTEAEEIELLELLEAEERERARKHHIDFIDYCWMKTSESFIHGFHTKIICDRIDKAFEDFRNGKSTYLKVSIHHRSGKSDMLSRYLPPHFLGEFPNCEVLATTYKADLTQKFTSDARNIFRSAKYAELYPDLALSKESNAKAYWELIDKTTKEPLYGKLYGSGLSSGITGSGGHLVLIDDPISGRADSESKTIRDKVWEAFTDDLMTRLADVHIVILLSTIWHWDDPHGRIEDAMERDPLFPHFESLSFPARASDYKGPGKYLGKYLFPERYKDKWYEEQYATLGIYSSKALMDCDPKHKKGAVFSTVGIIFHNPDDPVIPNYRQLKRVQMWDMAHTAKERSGDDPDYTSGTELAFERRIGDPVPHLWVFDRARFRENAPERDRKIKLKTKMKGHFIIHAVESSIDAKDAYYYLKQNIPDYKWEKVDCGKIDKAVRALPLEPIFEAPKHVHVIRGDWNKSWLEEIETFDGSGKDHDDAVDNLTAGYILQIEQAITIDKKTREELQLRKRAL